MNYVFLDIDGVLNSRRWHSSHYRLGGLKPYPLDQFDPDAVKRLNTITDTGAKIVVTSSWRTDNNLINILKEVGITGDIIGVTEVNEKTRGEQIEDWLKYNTSGKFKYVILDDESDFLTSQKPHLVRTTFEQGLLDYHVELALNILQ
jgi:hypothetical protein